MFETSDGVFKAEDLAGAVAPRLAEAGAEGGVVEALRKRFGKLRGVARLAEETGPAVKDLLRHPRKAG